jgi:hypothetical protein
MKKTNKPCTDCTKPKSTSESMIKSVSDVKKEKPCTNCKDKWTEVLKAEAEAAAQLEVIEPVILDEQTLNDVEFMTEIQKSKIMESQNVDKLFALYNRIHHTNAKRCNCPGLIRTFIERLNKHLNINI